MSRGSLAVAPLVVRALVQIYPKAWRQEYGLELADVLRARPLSIRVVGDVLSSGLAMRVHAIDVTTYLGLAAMAAIIAIAVLNAGGLLEETTKTLPTVVVAPMMSNLYVLFLVGYGCWLQLSRGRTASSAGVAAMKITFIAGVPVMVVGLLMLADVIDLQTTTRHAFNPWAVVVAPLLRLPECWIWGAVGAQLGRMLPRAALRAGRC